MPEEGLRNIFFPRCTVLADLGNFLLGNLEKNVMWVNYLNWPDDFRQEQRKQKIHKHPRGDINFFFSIVLLIRELLWDVGHSD